MFCNVTLLGNAGGDAEIKTLPTGSMVANLSVATTKSWQKDGQWESKTTWHKVTIFGNLAKVAEKIKKGDKVFIEGEISNRDYTDKDGIKRYVTEIKATTLKRINTPSVDTPIRDNAGKVNINPQYTSDTIPF